MIKKLRLKSKFFIMFTAFFAIVLVAIGLTISMGHRKNILRDYGEQAADIASFAADKLDGDEMATYAEKQVKDQHFFDLRGELKAIKEHLTNVEYLYVMVPNKDHTEATYIFDIYTDAEYARGGIDEGDLGFLETLDEENFGSALNTLRTGHISEELEITTTDYGYLGSTYAPIRNAAGEIAAIVGVDINMDEVMHYLKTFTIQMMSIVGSIVLVCCLLLLVLIQRSVINPIRQLDEKVCQFAASDHTDGCEKYIITLTTRDELSDVAQSFNRMMSEIETYITNLAVITAEKERIGAELNVATQIQASMLPSIFPAFPSRREFDIYATMTPAKEVGGDFYDFFMIDDDHLAVVIADVSGKGVPAALFMVIAKTLIKNYSQEGKIPADVFTSANNQLCEGNDAEMFVTGWMGVLEISSGKFTFVNAGHNPPLLKKADGSFEYLKSRAGFVLAGMEGTKYRQNEISLGKGDMLFLYTDGVTEATSIDQQLYGEERLQATLNKNASFELVDLLHSVQDDIDVFENGADQFDDITMLGLRIVE